MERNNDKYSSSNNSISASQANTEKITKYLGVWENLRFMHISTSILGSVVEIKHRDGSLWEGVFKSFSKYFVVCLANAIKVNDSHISNNSDDNSQNINLRNNQGLTDKNVSSDDSTTTVSGKNKQENGQEDKPSSNNSSGSNDTKTNANKKVENNKMKNNKIDFGPNIGNLHAAFKAGNKIETTKFFELGEIIRLSALDTNLNYVTRDPSTTLSSQQNQQLAFATDTEISGYGAKERDGEHMRELQAWQPDSDGELDEQGGIASGQTGKVARNNKKIVGNLEELPSSRSSGAGVVRNWGPDEMFKLNQVRFDVKTTYDENLSTYTVPLVKADTKERRKLEEEAARLAREIEGDAKSQSRLAKEDGGEDEEEEFIFSAVHRPTSSGPGPTPASTNSTSVAAAPTVASSVSNPGSNVNANITTKSVRQNQLSSHHMSINQGHVPAYGQGHSGHQAHQNHQQPLQSHVTAAATNNRQQHMQHGRGGGQGQSHQNRLNQGQGFNSRGHMGQLNHTSDRIGGRGQNRINDLKTFQSEFRLPQPHGGAVGQHQQHPTRQQYHTNTGGPRSNSHMISSNQMHSQHLQHVPHHNVQQLKPSSSSGSIISSSSVPSLSVSTTLSVSFSAPKHMANIASGAANRVVPVDSVDSAAHVQGHVDKIQTHGPQAPQSQSGQHIDKSQNVAQAHVHGDKQGQGQTVANIVAGTPATSALANNQSSGRVSSQIVNTSQQQSRVPIQGHAQGAIVKGQSHVTSSHHHQGQQQHHHQSQGHIPNSQNVQHHPTNSNQSHVDKSQQVQSQSGSQQGQVQQQSQQQQTNQQQSQQNQTQQASGQQQLSSATTSSHAAPSTNSQASPAQSQQTSTTASTAATPASAPAPAPAPQTTSSAASSKVTTTSTSATPAAASTTTTTTATTTAVTATAAAPTQTPSKGQSQSSQVSDPQLELARKSKLNPAAEEYKPLASWSAGAPMVAGGPSPMIPNAIPSTTGLTATSMVTPLSVAAGSIPGQVVTGVAPPPPPPPPHAAMHHHMALQQHYYMSTPQTHYAQAQAMGAPPQSHHHPYQTQLIATGPPPHHHHHQHQHYGHAPQMGPQHIYHAQMLPTQGAHYGVHPPSQAAVAAVSHHQQQQHAAAAAGHHQQMTPQAAAAAAAAAVAAAQHHHYPQHHPGAAMHHQQHQQQQHQHQFNAQQAALAAGAAAVAAAAAFGQPPPPNSMWGVPTMDHTNGQWYQPR